MKILLFATYPDQATGYARIACVISNYLASMGHEIYYVGISNYSGIERFIDPKITLIDALKERKADSTELYGVDIMVESIEKIKPDIVFIYNDVIVINRILNEFINTKMVKNFKLYIYMDLVYDYQKLILFKNINIWSDIIFVFSEYWKKNLLSIGLPQEKICILPHGVDTDIFYVKPNEAGSLPSEVVSLPRQKYGFNPDDFIILNTNRNSYRKALDITIDAFIKFLKKQVYNSKIKLFLNTVTNSTRDYNVTEIIKIVCLKNEADYNQIVMNHIFIRPSDTYLSDDGLNDLYNACDVGINTCVGEGFGLCNIEHACIGKPQIVSGVGALTDIFTNEYATIIKPSAELYISEALDFHQGYIKICSSDDFADAMERYYMDRELAKQHGHRAREVLTSKYNWSTILNYLNTFFLLE